MTRPAVEHLDGGEGGLRHAGFGLFLTSPLAWGAHFLACYVTAAVWCAKAAQVDGGLGWVRGAIVVYTVVALAVIGAVGLAGWHHHRSSAHPPPYEGGGRAERRRFMGWATVLLSGLSAVATVFVALVAAFIGSCR